MRCSQLHRKLSCPAHEGDRQSAPMPLEVRDSSERHALVLDRRQSWKELAQQRGCLQISINHDLNPSFLRQFFCCQSRRLDDSTLCRQVSPKKSFFVTSTFFPHNGSITAKVFVDKHAQIATCQPPRFSQQCRSSSGNRTAQQNSPFVRAYPPHSGSHRVPPAT
eukprot:2043019-Rhodomonas_salina.1